MPRILLSCRIEQEAQELLSYLQSELPYEIALANGLEGVNQTLKKKLVHLILMHLRQPLRQDLEAIRNLRAGGYKHPILVVTEEPVSAEFSAANERSKLYFLPSSFEQKTLKGLLPKILISREVPQQIHPRFRTNVPTVIQTLHSGVRYETQMYNLSQGGAYFEMNEKPAVVIGDLLRVRVQRPDAQGARQLNGRVVWMTHKGYQTGGFGFGIKFIKSSDIYRSLLNKM